MKSVFRITLLLLLPVLSIAQGKNIDSLKIAYRNASNDSARYATGRALYYYYEELNRDSALYYADENLKLSQNNHKKLAEAASLVIEGYQLLHQGKYPASLKCLMQALEITEDPNNKEETWPVVTIEPSPGKSRLLLLSMTHHMFGILMEQAQNIEQQIIHFKEAQAIAKQIGNANRQLLGAMNLGESYLVKGELDSALAFSIEANRISDASSLYKYKGFILSVIGDVYLKKGDEALAKKYYYAGLASAREQGNFASIARNNIRLINCFRDEGKKDSLLIYALRNLEVVRSLGTVVGQGENPNNIGTAYENVYLGYKLNNKFDSAFKYQGLALIAKDSLYRDRIKNLAEFQNMSFDEQLRLQNLEREKVINENKIRTWFLLAGIAILLLLAIFFYINNRQKHKAKIKIEKAYNDLRLTQQQLIQSEKMASLGELTAGIAHEIQNPLNFVNNFSDVNKELIEELAEERHKVQGTRDEELENELLNNIKGNEEKISHHGKRADAIVKGMLQHSRTGGGQKELTDINKLVDEYAKLAFHGMRAKDPQDSADKDFNAVPIAIAIRTDFDLSIGKINVTQQDIGRVILNLINNAFYAVKERQKGEGLGYKPTVTLKTRKVNNKIEISVRDNGSGIAHNIVDKIFQPFFTTKPTGQGTGLGLSLAYDIVKAHGGEIKVETTEGEKSEFVVQLPVTSMMP
jgi:two-component system, NtrC family, sensor kinase